MVELAQSNLSALGRSAGLRLDLFVPHTHLGWTWRACHVWRSHKIPSTAGWQGSHWFQVENVGRFSGSQKNPHDFKADWIGPWMTWMYGCLGWQAPRSGQVYCWLALCAQLPAHSRECHVPQDRTGRICVICKSACRLSSEIGSKSGFAGAEEKDLRWWRWKDVPLSACHRGALWLRNLGFKHLQEHSKSLTLPKVERFHTWHDMTDFHPCCRML